MTPTLAYKILTDDQMATLERDGSFDGAPIDRADGFVHLSTADQTAETLDKHFAGQDNLYLAAIDVEAAGAALRWEPSRGGALFPHLYAPLTLAIVTAYGPIERDADGKIKFPVAG